MIDLTKEKRAFDDYLKDVPFVDTSSFVDLCGGHELASAFHNGYIAGRDSRGPEIERKDEALKLTEEDRQIIIDNAYRSLRKHKAMAQGQMVTERDCIEAHVIFETIDYISALSTEEDSDDS